jgi:hypothetical protein
MAIGCRAQRKVRMCLSSRLPCGPAGRQAETQKDSCWTRGSNKNVLQKGNILEPGATWSASRDSACQGAANEVRAERPEQGLNERSLVLTSHKFAPDLFWHSFRGAEGLKTEESFATICARWAFTLALAIACSGVEGQDIQARLPRHWFTVSDTKLPVISSGVIVRPDALI